VAARISNKVYWLLGMVAWLFLIDHTNNTGAFTSTMNEQTVKREVIFFINGTMNNWAGAAKAAEALEQKTNKEVVVLYNQSKGFGVHDALETIAQNYLEPSTPHANDLVNVAGFLANLFTARTRTEELKNFYAIYQQYLEQNYKIVIVAHSQGNFFANELYDLITKDSSTPKKSGQVCGLDVVAVATPAQRTVGSGTYFIGKYDRMIGLLPTSLPRNEANSEMYQRLEDRLHHEFIKTYLQGDSTGPKILTAITNVFNAMSYPLECVPARDIYALTPPTSG
jgi:hypothetical protein